MNKKTSRAMHFTQILLFTPVSKVCFASPPPCSPSSPLRPFPAPPVFLAAPWGRTVAKDDGTGRSSAMARSRKSSRTPLSGPSPRCVLHPPTLQNPENNFSTEALQHFAYIGNILHCVMLAFLRMGSPSLGSDTLSTLSCFPHRASTWVPVARTS